MTNSAEKPSAKDTAQDLAERRARALGWRAYLPMDCYLCGRRRLQYKANASGDVVEVKCEKCGASSEWDAFTVEVKGD